MDRRRRHYERAVTEQFDPGVLRPVSASIAGVSVPDSPQPTLANLGKTIGKSEPVMHSVVIVPNAPRFADSRPTRSDELQRFGTVHIEDRKSPESASHDLYVVPLEGLENVVRRIGLPPLRELDKGLLAIAVTRKGLISVISIPGHPLAQVQLSVLPWRSYD
jgi:hypothetical protein